MRLLSRIICERAVVHWFHTEDVVNVVLVELNLVTGHFVCFGHDS